jgi:hypothetical protein
VRPKPFMAIAFAFVVTLVGVGGSAIAAPPTHKKAKCTLYLQTLAAPTATTGEAFGTSRCSGAFGNGVFHNTFTATPTSATTGSVTGPFKLYYDTGTVHGTYKFKYSVSTTGTTTDTGTATIMGGTGAYKHTRGSGKLTGLATDAHHSTFIYDATLTTAS